MVDLVKDLEKGQLLVEGTLGKGSADQVGGVKVKGNAFSPHLPANGRGKMKTFLAAFANFVNSLEKFRSGRGCFPWDHRGNHPLQVFLQFILNAPLSGLRMWASAHGLVRFYRVSRSLQRKEHRCATISETCFQEMADGQ